MDEGTIFVVIIFPTPWPPPTRIRLISKSFDSGSMELTADPHGRIIFSLFKANTAVQTQVFQPMQIVGAGRAILSVSWSLKGVALRVNGLEITPESEAAGVLCKIDTKPDPIRRAPIAPKIDPTAAKTEEENLFLSTITDIDNKLLQGDKYSLIRAAGLLRQLLLDATPLVHLVNRQYHLRIQFERSEYLSEPPVKPNAWWINPDASSFPNPRTVVVNLDQFLGSRCLVLEERSATVGDIISACANIKGGVHLGKARSPEDKVVLQWDEAFRLLGEQPSILALAGICRVALHGLEPLVRAIQAPKNSRGSNSEVLPPPS